MINLLFLQISVFFSRDTNLETIILNAIDNAQKTIDISIYSFWGSPTADNIKNAIINAKNRGIRIRIIAENYIANSNSNSYPYISQIINSGIPVLFDSTTNIGYGCQYNSGYLNHQKFIVIDSQIVILGSFNLTYNALNVDANDLVIINDKNFANRFIKEFEMIWGGNENIPNTSHCKFQNYKSNLGNNTFYYNTPIVDSMKVFFSPTGNTYNVLASLISKAQSSIYIALSKFTLCNYRDSLYPKKNFSYFVVDYGTWNDKPAMNIRGLNITPDPYCTNFPWQPPGNILLDNVPNNGLLHYKFAVFDRYIVLTGSMNWTFSGAYRNDEVVLVIYSNYIANKYFNEFSKRWQEAGGQSNTREYINIKDGNLVIKNYKGSIEIYSIDGKLIRKVLINNDFQIKLQKGIYIVKAEKLRKFIVVP